jgi:heptosyltransferase I
MTQSICILRLSALGDVVNVVPMLHDLQQQLPGVHITWIIGATERRLVGDIPGVEFITFDKRGGWAAVRAVRRELAGRRFDALFIMQRSLRANLLSTQIRARQRIGYDFTRSAELHSLFINQRIAYKPRQHILDLLGSFIEPLGLVPGTPRWDIPVPDEAREFALQQLPAGPPVLLISPCSSMTARTWSAEGYAALANHAMQVHGWRVVLCGGRSDAERRMGDAIQALLVQPALDLIAKDTFKRFLGLLQRVTLVVSPDSGPLHMANAMGVPVLGLHAATPAWGSGPYSDQRWCVDCYEQAAMKYRGKPADQLPWGARIHEPGVMDLITPEAVIAAFEGFVREGLR